MTWPPHQMTWHASKQVTSPPWNSRRLVHSKEMVWASRWSVALRTFYRQILSLLYSSFFFWNFRPRLARELLVYYFVGEISWTSVFSAILWSSHTMSCYLLYCHPNGYVDRRGIVELMIYVLNHCTIFMLLWFLQVLSKFATNEPSSPHTSLGKWKQGPIRCKPHWARDGWDQKLLRPWPTVEKNHQQRPQTEKLQHTHVNDCEWHSKRWMVTRHRFHIPKFQKKQSSLCAQCYFSLLEILVERNVCLDFC